MELYFVRHGETNYNELDLCNDDPTKDVHLTEKGKRQAQEIADKLREVELDLIYISELPRTRETADIIKQYHDVDMVVDPRINDRKTGYDSRLVPEFLAAIQHDPFNIKLNDGESFQEEKKRVFSFLEDIIGKNHSSVLVVTHNEIMKVIYGYFHGLSDSEMWAKKIDNCHIFHYST